jgi:Tfp pilus assembly protein PilX
LYSVVIALPPPEPIGSELVVVVKAMLLALLLLALLRSVVCEERVVHGTSRESRSYFHDI